MSALISSSPTELKSEGPRLKKMTSTGLPHRGERKSEVFSPTSRYRSQSPNCLRDCQSGVKKVRQLSEKRDLFADIPAFRHQGIPTSRHPGIPASRQKATRHQDIKTSRHQDIRHSQKGTQDICSQSAYFLLKAYFS